MPDSPDPAATAEPNPPEPGAATPLDERDLLKLDPRSLRGLAHPLRMRLLATLRHDGPATASQLAHRLGESSGATSYHLRQLAAHGFVVEDTERGKGRERWWKSAHQGTLIDAALYHDPDPEVRGALNTFIHESASMHGQELSTWIGTMHSWSDAWVTRADFSDFTLHLSPDQMEELDTKVHELIESYRGITPTEGAEDAQVRVHLHMFPRATD